MFCINKVKRLYAVHMFKNRKVIIIFYTRFFIFILNVSMVDAYLGFELIYHGCERNNGLNKRELFISF